MRRFRQLLVSAAIAVALLLPLAGAASADPGDGGFMGASITTSGAGAPDAWTSTSTDPGDGGF